MNQRPVMSIAEFRRLRGLAPVGAKPRKPRKPLPLPTCDTIVTPTLVSFPVFCKVVSEANTRDHWAARFRRGTEQQKAVSVAFVQLPRTYWRAWEAWHVTIVRVGGKALDPDNLAGGFKAVQDRIAAWLGVDDGDASRVTWSYRQEPNTRQTPIVRVELRKGVAT